MTHKMLTQTLAWIANWCIGKHASTNHFYDKYLPYEFHLRMANAVFQEFKELLDDTGEYYGPDGFTYFALREVCERAVWGHDLIEDARVSYNDCVEILGKAVADVIYAVTNYRGRNRAERAPRKLYMEMRNVQGATFVKLCDRIANVQYSKLTKSSQYDMYKKENEEFVHNIGTEYPTMIDYLNKIFET